MDLVDRRLTTLRGCSMRCKDMTTHVSSLQVAADLVEDSVEVTSLEKAILSSITNSRIHESRDSQGGLDRISIKDRMNIRTNQVSYSTHKQATLNHNNKKMNLK